MVNFDGLLFHFLCKGDLDWNLEVAPADGADLEILVSAGINYSNLWRERWMQLKVHNLYDLFALFLHLWILEFHKTRPLMPILSLRIFQQLVRIAKYNLHVHQIGKQLLLAQQDIMLNLELLRSLILDLLLTSAVNLHFPIGIILRPAERTLMSLLSHLINALNANMVRTSGQLAWLSHDDHADWAIEVFVLVCVF